MKNIFNKNLLITIFSCCIAPLQVNCQTQVRDKIAIVVNYMCDDCNLGKESIEKMNSAIYAWHVLFLEKQQLFQVVNRGATESSIIQLNTISETRYGKGVADTLWAKYVNNLKEKSKGIGAKWLLMIDNINLKINKEVKTYYRYKIINVENNLMYTFSIDIKSTSNLNKTPEQWKDDIKESLSQLRKDLSKEIDRNWNTSWQLKSINGKNFLGLLYSLSPAPIGMYVYWFEWKEYSVGSDKYCQIKKLGSSTLTGRNKEGMTLTSENNLDVKDINKVMGQIYDGLRLTNDEAYPLSVLEFKLTQDDKCFVNYDLNTQLYDAIRMSPQFFLIQIEEKDIVYAEKNIQKGEEFLDGSTVKQSNSSKGEYLLLCNDLGSTLEKYKVELKLVNKATGIIIKNIIIDCLPKDYKHEIAVFLNQVLMHQCRIIRNGSKSIDVFTHVRLNMHNDVEYNIVEMRKIELQGKTESIRVPLAKIKLIEQLGQRASFKIIEVLDAKFNDIKETNTYFLSLTN